MATTRESHDRYAYDGGTDDPRMLVYWYQQRVRTELLQQTRRRWWSAYVDAARTIMRELLAPNPARSAPAPQTRVTPTAF